MRTTIDLPDPLFRRTKALAAVRGSSLKQLVIGAIEREVNGEAPSVANTLSRRARFPQIHLRTGRPLDLRKFDFDDLLG